MLTFIRLFLVTTVTVVACRAHRDSNVAYKQTVSASRTYQLSELSVQVAIPDAEARHDTVRRSAVGTQSVQRYADTTQDTVILANIGATFDHERRLRRYDDRVSWPRLEIIDRPWAQLTDTSHAFAKPEESGSLRITEGFPNLSVSHLAHKQDAPGHIAGGGREFWHIAADDDLRKNLVGSLVAVVDQFDYDGIDVDLEFPTRENASSDALLLADLRIALDAHENTRKRHFYLSTDLPGSHSPRQWFGLHAVSSSRDTWHVMAYNLAEPLSAATADHSPLHAIASDPEYEWRSVDKVVANWHETRGVEKEELVAGNPLHEGVFPATRSGETVRPSDPSQETVVTFAEIPGETEKSCVDVALNDGGLIRGTVLSTAAQPVAGVAVAILHNENNVATVLSDKKGEFAVKGLRNGAHVLQAGTTRQIVRLWGINSAPPTAVENIAIVVDEEAVQGQLYGDGGLGGGIGRLGEVGELGVATAVTLGTTPGNDANSIPANP